MQHAQYFNKTTQARSRTVHWQQTHRHSHTCVVLLKN